MPYSGGNFSVYSPGNPVQQGTSISSTVHNNTNNDFATGLSQCVLKDGSQTLTSDIPFGNFKITGLGAGSALTDSATLRQVQYGFGSFLTSVAGTNTITATATPTPAYTVGQRFTFIPAVTNTGATTLNISSVGAGAVQFAGAALTGGELVVSVPVTVYVTAATPVFEIVGVVPASLRFTTGDVKLTLKAVADTGWVMCDDGTIGNAASGGTTRANADTVALFTLLWNNVADAQAAVSTGRGANAAADYAANKTIALTKMLGRAFGASGAGSGLTSRVLGLATGVETHPLTIAELAAHTHPQHANTVLNDLTSGTSVDFNVNATGLGGTTQSTGSGTAHQNMQPTAFVNAMIKL